MSVFSIIQNSQQQMFNLQMKGRMPETAKPPSNNPKDNDDAQQKADAKLIERAGQLVSTTTPQSEEAQSEADDIVEDFKEAVDLNSKLSRAVKDGADTEREMRIERMAQKIKALKERLRFATPEQAKRMLQELQQISKDFKTASIELRKAAEKIGPDRPNTVVDVAAEATVSALGNKDVSSEVTLTDLLGYAEDFTSSLQTIAPASAQTAADADPGLASTSGSSVAAPSEQASEQAKEQATEQTGPLEQNLEKIVSVFEALESSGFIDELQSDLARKNDAAFRKASVYAYADMQHQSDSFHRQSRIEGMRAEHEALSELFEEIALLAGQLETLADQEDEEVREAMASIIKNLAEGFEVLDEDDLQQFLGAGRYAPPSGVGGDAGPSTVVSMSSISVETSVSISISGVVV